ncbi:MAG TPA: asparaginase, partial [Gammaproteobacteria bacterium]|nr:asparaginase [Gammaproteobacteria bacterium]
MQYTHNPILVTLTRGAITESVHRGAFALVDDTGHTRLAVGDVLRPIYPRSA